jgi:hypothetical protein
MTSFHDLNTRPRSSCATRPIEWCWRSWGNSSRHSRRGADAQENKSKPREGARARRRKEGKRWASASSSPRRLRAVVKRCGDCHQATRLRESDLGCPLAN